MYSCIVVLCLRCTEVLSERVYERPHGLVGGARPTEPTHERLGGFDPPRPRQDVLIGSGDLSRPTGDRHRELMIGGPKCRCSGRFGNLANDLPKHAIRRREGDAAFDLNFQQSRASLVVVGVYDNVIERMTPRTSLKLDAVNDDAG